MLIVNKERKILLNLQKVWYLRVESDGVYAYFEETECKRIGYYSDSKRAKDVLQELWSAYANGDKVFIMPEN